MGVAAPKTTGGIHNSTDTEYKLPRQEKSDRIVTEDFNGQAVNLEVALASYDTVIAGLNSAKADKAMTDSL